MSLPFMREILGYNLIALCTVTFPAKRLKIIFCGTTALCYRDDVVYFKQQIRLNMGGVFARATCEIITLFDEITQFFCH